MPIYLKAPAYLPAGPDGKGWNRISLAGGASGPGAQCALRPTDWGSLYESARGTQFAAWGGYGPCVREGDCRNCPYADTTRVTTLDRPSEDRVLVRVLDGVPHVMVNPDTGWEGWSYPWTWTGMRRLQGWRIGRAMRDEHSEGFWLERAA